MSGHVYYSALLCCSQTTTSGKQCDTKHLTDVTYFTDMLTITKQ